MNARWWPLFLVLSASAPQPDAGAPVSVAIGAREFKIASSESGPVNYYSLVEALEGPYIHAAYKTGYKTAVLGYEIPEKYRDSTVKVRWKWRARVLPKDGNECAANHEDSAAVVYVTFRNGLKWYALKYVWSSVGPKGESCDRKNNPFRAQETTIVESGGPLNEWRTMEVDVASEFRKHFRDGDPKADVPTVLGIGIMTDGDQTGSPSEADYGGFELILR